MPHSSSHGLQGLLLYLLPFSILSQALNFSPGDLNYPHMTEVPWLNYELLILKPNVVCLMYPGFLQLHLLL